jgi:hypothetical protein
MTTKAEEEARFHPESYNETAPRTCTFLKKEL